MLDRLDPALENREERPLAALVHRVLAGQQGDVGGRARQPLALRRRRARRRSRSRRSRPASASEFAAGPHEATVSSHAGTRSRITPQALPMPGGMTSPIAAGSGGPAPRPATSAAPGSTRPSSPAVSSLVARRASVKCGRMSDRVTFLSLAVGPARASVIASSCVSVGAVPRPHVETLERPVSTASTRRPDVLPPAGGPKGWRAAVQLAARMRVTNGANP